MSNKKIIKIVINDKKIVQKQNLDMTLDKLRESLKDKLPNNYCFIMGENEFVDREQEFEFTIEDILNEYKEVNCSLDFNDVNVNEKINVKENGNVNDNVDKKQILQGAKYLRKENNLELYLYSSKKIKIEQTNKNENDKKYLLDISKKINHKTILVVGETGSGKTTMINILINFLCDIDLKDDHRYILIDELANDSGVEDYNDQSKSKTSFITIYNIDSIGDYPSITIIDTPGFGDTRGKEFDKEIFKMINNLFTNFIDIIDAVCLIANATLYRLTESEKYIMRSIVSIFGNDIAENFILMLTHCDVGTPGILHSLLNKESIFYNNIYPYIKYDKNWYLKFNNMPAFFKDTSENLTEAWNMGMISFKLFIEKLAQLQPKSLKLSKEIIDFRKKMEVKILKIMPLYEEYLYLIKNKNNKQFEITYYKNIMDQSKNFQIIKQIKEKIQKKVPIPKKKNSKTCGQYKKFYNCIKCKITCNPNDLCNGKCKGCGCLKKNHRKKNFKYENVTREFIETNEYLKSQYYDSKNHLSSSEISLGGIEENLKENMATLFNLHNELTEYIKDLEKKALYFNFDEYISNFTDNKTGEKIKLMLKKGNLSYDEFKKEINK